MHVRIRVFGKPDTIVVVESKLTKIEQFRRIINNKFDVEPKLQRLFYGGKLLEDGYSFHDYNIKLNDVIQLMAKIQDLGNSPPNTSEDKPKTVDKEKKGNNETKQYKDAESNLYAVGDLIDIRDQEHGAWYEGKISRIVYNPDIPCIFENGCNSDDCDSNESIGKENDAGNKLPSDTDNGSPKGKGIEKYFTKSPKVARKKHNKKNEDKKQIVDADLLYKVEFDDGEEDSAVFCKLNEIRPRARKVIDPKDLQIDQTIMLNYNTDDPHELGLWYDFKVADIKKIRSAYDLIGTLYLGPEAVPQNDTKVRVKDKIYAIEQVVPLAKRSDEYKKIIATVPEKRTAPLNCFTCRDDEDSPCKDCGCYLCSGKEFPEKIVLCDECNKGYHMICLDPPLTELPEDDWYCPSCKRDTNDVIAPGAAKQTKKTLTTKRDWGRGMACVGKTKTCAMPANHFGPIPGIEVGMRWRFRIQLSETGVHRPPVSGIHGRDVEGAYSIVLSGGYEDDVDFGNEFTYTGSGGRDLSGNKRTAEQSCDQTLTRENKALARNCAVKQISEEGGDAGEDWRHGRPVRVVRSYKMLKHFPKYAPKEGIRYDGIYKVVKYYPEKGLSGFRVWKYLLRRDDPTPAPWEPDAKQYPLVYPDGYLEAEAEKKAQKEKGKGNASTKGKKKRTLKEINQSTDTDSEASSPVKKKKKNLKRTLKELLSSDSENDSSPLVKKKKNNVINGASRTKKSSESKQNGNIADIFKKSPTAKKKPNCAELKNNDNPLTAAERDTIEKDTLNSKLWDECLIVCDTRGKQEFVEYVTQMFVCIICQEVAVSPVTTPCLHNFCMACIKMAFKSTAVQCPCCRKSLVDFDLEINENLKTALRCVLAGYDAGKK